jgi:hypothetical protein
MASINPFKFARALCVVAALHGVAGCHHADAGVDAAPDGGGGTATEPDTGSETVSATESGTETGIDAGTDSGTGDDAGLPFDTDTEQTFWHTFYGSSGIDWPIDMRVLEDGNVEILGASAVPFDGPGGEPPASTFTPEKGTVALFLVVLSPAGEYVSHTFVRVDTYGFVNDEPYDITLSQLQYARLAPDGGIFVAGASTESWDGPDGEAPLLPHSGIADESNSFLLRLDDGGAYVWHAFFAPGSEAVEIAPDDQGGAIVTGLNYSTPWSGPEGYPPVEEDCDTLWAPPYCWWALRFDADGLVRWYTVPTVGGYDAVIIASAARDGGLWVAREAHNIHGEGVMVTRFASDGHTAWSEVYGDTPGFAKYPNNLFETTDGAVCVAGSSDNSWKGPQGEEPVHAHSGWNGDVSDLSSGEPFVLCLGPDGAYRWHAFYGGVSNPAGMTGLAVSPDGRVLVANSSAQGWTGPGGKPPRYPFAGTKPEFFLLELRASDGAYRWHGFFASAGILKLAHDEAETAYALGISAASWQGPGGEAPLHDHSGSLDVFALAIGP